MTTSERREEIARTLFLSDYDEFTPDKIDASSTWLTLRESYLTNADALLAAFPVLAGVTDEMVEAGLAALRHRPGITYGVSDAVLRPITRAVLAAVLGPRDGSTR